MKIGNFQKGMVYLSQRTDGFRQRLSPGQGLERVTPGPSFNITSMVLQFSVLCALWEFKKQNKKYYELFSYVNTYMSVSSSPPCPPQKKSFPGSHCPLFNLVQRWCTSGVRSVGSKPRAWFAKQNANYLISVWRNGFIQELGQLSAHFLLLGRAT